MKIYRSTHTFLILFLLISSAIFAQDYTKHTVAKGETITQIAQRYKVTPYDIYKLNPDSQKGIKENDILLVPALAKSNTPEAEKPKLNIEKPTTHTAKPKETLFSIAREYNVTVDDLRNANPFLSEGLKIGQVIRIPSNTSTTIVSTPTKTTTVTTTTTTPVKNGKAIYHTVESKETKFGIAKKYGITVAELERQNPGIVQSLPVGYKLSIGGSLTPPPTVYEVVTEKPKPTLTDKEASVIIDTETIKTVKKTGYANYEVKPKETLFSLTQMFNISEEELIRLNPHLKEGVQIGMILKVPGRGSFVKESRKGFDNLAMTTINTDRKRLVMLLPFNSDKIQGDTIKSLAARLKKDAFLNMTLDFYSGALMAIDSAKVLGLNIDVKIYDSQESKTSSNVANIVKNHNLQDADAVIGPFYQQYAETVAGLLNKDNVPVISPLSKDSVKPISNLYQAMPPADYSKSAIFDYMISKGGNIVVVSDPKKAANREFITQNYKEAKFVELSENGTLVADNLKAILVAGKMNYVVLDSEKTGMILSTTNVLLNEMANHQVQLVIIEPNETLDFDEISMKRLTILQMLYPSLSRENNSDEATFFENEYKKKNKIYPSQYAVRGFDVTFDTMLRLSQGKSFEAAAAEYRTEQVESKFDYSRKDSEGYINKGIYILQYNEDLSVKEAN